MLDNILIPLEKRIRTALKKAAQLLKNGNLAGAEQLYHRILNLNPDHAETLQLLGAIRMTQGRNGTAYNLIRRGLDSEPSPRPASYFKYGLVLERLNRTEEAIKAYRKVIELKKDHMDAWLGCVRLHLTAGRLAQALEASATALDINPDVHVIRAESGNVLMQLGRHAEAETAFRKTLEALPNFSAAMQNLMLNYHYMPGMTLERLQKYHTEFAARARATVPVRQDHFPQSRDPGRTLRIGFVSSDFRRHPIGYFMAPFLPHLDRQEIITTCYSDNPGNDDMTDHIRDGADNWVPVSHLHHRALAKRIERDKIDILFDLNGHTGRSRLLAFARKPAPIQVSWAGYVGTTGLEEMDYIIADRFHIHDDEKQFYVEKVLRLSECNFVVRPPDFAPKVSSLPVLKNGYITFGTFSIPTKINPEIINVWCRIMQKVEGSKMIFKYRAVDDPANIERIGGLFRQGGIDPARLQFYGMTPHVDLLDHYNRIDIALDPAPYSGGLTTCEALWMGTPVVTCPGNTFCSRHTQSILSCVGLTETIAGDFDQYVDIAINLSEDRPRLAAISAGLRDKMAGSPLVDGAAFAGKFSAAMRQIWTDWCRNN